MVAISLAELVGVLRRIPCDHAGGSDSDAAESDLSRARSSLSTGEFRRGRCLITDGANIDGHQSRWIAQSAAGLYAREQPAAGAESFANLLNPVTAVYPQAGSIAPKKRSRRFLTPAAPPDCPRE